MPTGGTFRGVAKASHDCLGGQMYHGRCEPLNPNARHPRAMSSAVAGQCRGGTYKVLGGACMGTPE